jgi:fused signal recognition particle receptor
LVHKIHNQHLSVDVVACDTFRAAANTQLEEWTNKLGCKLFKGENKEPASVAYTALSNTKSDVLIVDTAGRLPTNSNLMDELGKIYRVLKKINSATPHLNLVIIDTGTGQNAIEQVKAFNVVAKVNGVILSKFDTGSKGGTIVRIANELRVPIYGVGTGEKVEDFETFNVSKFIKHLIEE